MSSSFTIKKNLSSNQLTRQQSLHFSSLGKASEKLSSGLRINRAADDAAGLSISESMRSQIKALTQASRNTQDAISFIQTGEGALNEVHDMINRLEELAVQAANDTYSLSDRNHIQSEVQALKQAIDDIAQSTHFNGINLFKVPSAPLVSLAHVSEYKSTQISSGVDTTDPYSDAFIDKLEHQIVPQAVQALIKTFPAFDYLADSSIGIGLRLYSDDASDVLASVTSTLDSNKDYSNAKISYTLAINMAHVDWDEATSTIINRSALEATIAHEMTHALMDESLTASMLGNPTDFTEYFKEGVAQLVSGPGNWVKDILQLNASSSNAEIKNAIFSSPSKDAQLYGASYLTTAFMGYLANGGTGQANASAIANGINKILGSLISGNSYNDTIKAYTGFGQVATYSTDAFKTSDQFYDFVRTFLSNSKDGLGSILSGNLTSADILADSDLSLNLFKLNSSADVVTNDYTSTGVTVMSGGKATSSGQKPIDTYPTVTLTDSSASIIKNINLSDCFTQIRIEKDGIYNFTGTGNENVNIHISKDCTVTLNFNNAVVNPSKVHGIRSNNTSHVTINASGNTIISSNSPYDKGICIGGTLNLNGDLEGSIINFGTLNNNGNIKGNCNNYGTIINAGHFDSITKTKGTIKHLPNAITKNITPPLEVAAGETLALPTAASLVVTYNGDQTKTLNGTWSIYDENNTLISDPTNTTAELGKTYTYQLTFTAEDDICFDNSRVHYLRIPSSDNEIVLQSTSALVQAYTPSISPDQQTLVYTYRYTVGSSPSPSHPIDAANTILFQVGDSDQDTIAYALESIDTTSIGLNDLDVTNASINNLDKLSIAREKISTVRSNLGALQNRLEHTHSNLCNTTENLTAAESRIRDTDIALEMSNYTRYQMLIQATATLLSQANLQQQQVLNLLR